MQNTTKTDTSEAAAPDRTEAIARLKVLAAFCAGVVFSMSRPILHLSAHNRAVSRPLNAPTGHFLFDALVHFFEFIGSTPVNLLVVVLFTYLAIAWRRRPGPQAWVPALVAGNRFVILLFHSLLGWI